MKKIFYLALFLSLISCEKKHINKAINNYPIYTPIKVYGSITLGELNALPSGAESGELANYNDTVWLYLNDDWNYLWPTEFTGTLDYVPLTRTINGLALSSNISLTYTDVGAVPTSRTINGLALTSNITLDASHFGLENVTNESKQTMFFNPAFTGTATFRDSTLGDIITNYTGSYPDSILSLRGDVNELINNTVVGPNIAALNILLTDSVLVANDSTKYIFTCVENDGFAGKNLVALSVVTEEQTYGTAVPVVHAYRLRSGTRNVMTSTGANFTTLAVINSTYDDITVGDKIMFKCTSLGEGTGTVNVRIIAIFQ